MNFQIWTWRSRRNIERDFASHYVYAGATLPCLNALRCLCETVNTIRRVKTCLFKLDHVGTCHTLLVPHLFTVQTQPNNFTLILSGFITTDCVFPCVSYHFLSWSCRFLKFCVSTVVLGVKSLRLQTRLPKACHPACQRIWNALSCQVFVEFELFATGCHRLVMANSKLEELVSPVWKRKLDRLILFKWFQMRKSLLRSNQSESRKAQEYSAALVRFDWPQGFHSNVSFSCHSCDTEPTKSMFGFGASLTTAVESFTAPLFLCLPTTAKQNVGQCRTSWPA